MFCSRKRAVVNFLDILIITLCDDQGETAVGTGGGGVAGAKIRVEARRALTCDDQTVGSVICAVYLHTRRRRDMTYGK
jgi:hypothetical protein